MHKTVRNFAIVALLSLASAPMMKADPMGTNPKPKGSAIRSSLVETLQYTVLAYFGL